MDRNIRIKEYIDKQVFEDKRQFGVYLVEMKHNGKLFTGKVVVQ